MSQRFTIGGPGPAAQNPQEVLQRALALHRAGHVADAVPLYQQVLKTHPKSAPVLAYCGAAMLDLKRAFEGTQMLHAAIAADPNHAEAHTFLGNAHQMAGRLDAAEASYAKALELQPENTQGHNNLGVLLVRMGRHDDAVERFRTATALDPDYAQAHNNLAQALVTLNRAEEAIAAAERATTLQPELAEAHNTLGSALSKAGRMDAAIAAYQTALTHRPEFADALNNLAVALIIAGRAGEAVAACDRALALVPTSVPALASKAVALSEAGDAAALNAHVDFDGHIRTQMVDPTPDFADAAAFNAAVVEHVIHHPSLTYELEGHATRKGKHTGELLTDPKGPFETFERMVDRAVAAYLEALDPASDHPVMRTAPKSWRLTAWSVVLQEAGHQVPHIHESGWLSGVYYPKVPHDIGPSEEDPSGWIEFGLPQDLYQVRRAPTVRLYRPEEGMMILFPSYFFHRTVPTGSTDLRVSVAFDVMRRG